MFTRRVSLFVFVSVFALCLTASGADFYVSPSGSATGTGSLSQPWDLKTALAHPAAVKAGDTIWLRGGTYAGTFYSRLLGSASAPIIVRNYSGERAILDGSLAGQTTKNVPVLDVGVGGYVWFWGLEITNSDPQRVITITGSNPPERRGTGLNVSVAGVKAINNLIYDAGQGISAYTNAIDFEATGNVIYNNGWEAPDRGHGHGIYTQNNTGLKSYEDNVVAHQFGDATHIYGSTTSYLKNIDFTGNLWLNGRVLLGGGSPLENIGVDSNVVFNTVLELGYTSGGNHATTVTNNYVVGGIHVVGFSDININNNTVFGLALGNAPHDITFSASSGVPLSAYAIDQNTYYQSHSLGYDFVFYGASSYTFAAWQGLGFDLGGKYIRAGSLPTTPKVILRPNKYDSSRAYLAIHNWALSSVVQADLSSFLSIGDSYELHNALDYFNDVITGTYQGGQVSVPMTNHTVAMPLGYTQLLGADTFPAMGGFVLVRKPGAATVTVSPSTGTVSASQTLQLSATVSGTSDQSVTWSVASGPGTVSSSGLYTAPTSVSSTQNAVVKATSVANPSASASATLQVAAPQVSVVVTAPASTVGTGGTIQLSAAVSGTSNTGVTWSISPTVGTISSTGLYTAPASVSSSQTVTAKATSVADATKSGSLTITVSPAVTISLSPMTVTVAAGKTQQFTASVSGTTNSAVTWTLSSPVGSVSTTGLYTAPATVTTSQTVQLTAKSAADTTKSVTATITVSPTQTSTSTSSTGNAVINPGFETSSGQGWMLTANGGRSITTAQRHGGSYSQQFAGSTQYPREVYQDVPVTAGKTVAISGWAMSSAVTSRAAITVVWLNATGLGQILSSSNVLRTDTLGSVTGTQAWTNLTGRWVAPTGARVARIRIFMPVDTTSARAWFDDFAAIAQ